ncbi:hypothetical protein RCC89_14310 [Cytophagaceae bacterium ABcell3]|nr:hypothetical protein RCC89_14310 [Cytophagaceae bacterium ABcell3]
MNSSKEERKNERIGIIVSVAAHALFLLFFLIFTAWKEPYPPNPGIPGVELALGFEDVGSGDANDAAPESDAEPEDTEVEETEAPDPTPDPTPDAEPLEDASEPDPVVESGSDIQSAPVESPHTVPDSEKSAPKPKEAKDTKKPESENKEEKKEKKENVASENMMPSGGSSGDTDKKGNQGSEEGSVDAQNVYGSPGGGGGGGSDSEGPELDIDGWKWDDKPDKKDSSNESGKIVFEIRVDDQGWIKNSKVLEATVSPSVVQFYKQQVDRLTFTRSSSSQAPPVTVGRITIVVKSR